MYSDDDKNRYPKEILNKCVKRMKDGDVISSLRKREPELIKFIHNMKKKSALNVMNRSDTAEELNTIIQKALESFFIAGILLVEEVNKQRQVDYLTKAMKLEVPGKDKEEK